MSPPDSDSSPPDSDSSPPDSDSSPEAGPSVGAAGSFDRAEALRMLTTGHFDVLVIGGGITGAGVALDAASRGLRTALVEKGDFASGTSSKSSKMVHGGIRYLEQREFRLVYESLHERQRLLDNAPHLVSPLPFLIPLFGQGGVVAKNVARAYATALWLYDITGGWRIGKRHKRITRSETMSHLPTLRTDRLVAGFLYFDARADDARLTLTIARTAALDHGAVIANYVEVVDLLHDASGRVKGARVRSSLPYGDDKTEPQAIAAPEATQPAPEATQPVSGETKPAPRETKPAPRETKGSESATLDVRAKVVVNATGIWADEVRALEEGRHPRSIRPAKGIHVTIPRSKLPADVAAVIPVPKDHRSIFVVPWPDGDDVYLGTTDTDYDGSLDDPACLPEDVDYVISAANALTTNPLTREDVTGIWAGLRPLLSRSDGRHVSERTADMSRRHTVRVSPGGMVTVTGGKLTTYRKMAQDTVDAVVSQLGPSVSDKAKKCVTARLRLRGARGTGELHEPGAAKRFGLDDETFMSLLSRHGGETPEVLGLASGRSDLLEPLVPGLPYLRVEALWAARHEMAMTLQDVLARRTRSLIRRARPTLDAAESVAKLLAPEWQRSASDSASELESFGSAALADLERAGLGRAGLAVRAPS